MDMGEGIVVPSAAFWSEEFGPGARGQPGREVGLCRLRAPVAGRLKAAAWRWF